MLETGTTGSLGTNDSFTIDLQGRSGGNAYAYFGVEEIGSVEMFTITYSYSYADQGQTTDTIKITNDSTTTGIDASYVVYRYT